MRVGSLIPVAAENGTASWAEARQSPCATCDESPCCQFLPLEDFHVRTMMDLDRLSYLANFDGIELGLQADGRWSVYLRRPCRHLSPDDYSCTVHDTPEQPHVCEMYNPFKCWYRERMGAGTDDFLRVDRRRLDFILAGTRFDERRRVTEAPAWEEMEAAFKGMPLAVNADYVPASDPTVVVAGDGRCEGCAGHCCDSVRFAIEAPASKVGLDFIEFQVNFPGVELHVTGDRWEILVHSRCRHFVAGRCAVYGQPERPLRCRFHDTWTCDLRAVFDERWPTTLDRGERVGAGDVGRFAERFALDGDGIIEGTI